jgi:hypothetical protein
MKRYLLHKTKLEEFKAWLDKEGIQHRPGKGDWQVLQVCTPENGFQVVFSQLKMPEYYSLNEKLEPTVLRFINETKNSNTLTQSQCTISFRKDADHMPVLGLKREKTIGELIDAYRAIQLERTAIAAKDKALIADQKVLQEKIFAAFEAENTTAGRGALGAASITWLDVPKVVDEKKASAVLKRKGWGHIFSLKFTIEPAAWREAKDRLGGDIEGIETVMLKKLSVTKA